MTPPGALQGMSIAVLGPTFQNLAENVRRNVTDIYFVFVGRSLGYLGGSVLGGVLFDCVNAHLLLGEPPGRGGTPTRGTPGPRLGAEGPRFVLQVPLCRASLGGRKGAVWRGVAPLARQG